MKKFWIFLVILLLLIAFHTNGLLIATASFNGEYSIYEKDIPIDTEYDLSLVEALLKKSHTSNINGESIRFIGNDKDIDYLIYKLNIKVVDDYYFSNIRTIYGYSYRLGDTVKISGKKVNIQITKRGSTIIVGCPIIRGSY